MEVRIVLSRGWLLELMSCVTLLAICPLAGCADSSHRQPKRADTATTSLQQEQPAWEWIDAGRYRVQITRLVSLQNPGLQLPVVSPDGRWVAALACSQLQALDPEATLTGQTMSSVSLVLYDTAHPQSPSRTIATGAAWPVWTPDSVRLIAVAYDKPDHCGLIIHDLSTGQTRRLEIGLAHIVTPALSPTGNRLAFAAFSQIPRQSRLYVYDLDKSQLTPLAAPKDIVWQVMPMWVNDRALIYYGRVGTETGLLGATADGASRQSWLTKLGLPDEVPDVIRAQAGILQPLSPDRQWLATFNASNNRIELTHLDDAKAVPLGATSQAGIWAGYAPSIRFVHATEKQLRSHNLAGNSNILAAQPLVPLWCSNGGRNMLLVSPGQQPWSFELVRLQILQAK